METGRGKPVSSSKIEDHCHRIFPNDLNPCNTLFGGVIMSSLDRIASVIAERHSEKHCVTVSCDSIHFLKPAGAGEILVFKGSVNRVWRTSLEIGIKVYASRYTTTKNTHIVSAYFTFVALGDDGKPTPIPSVIPETEEEKRRYDEADQRRTLRRKTAEELRKRDEQEAS